MPTQVVSLGRVGLMHSKHLSALTELPNYIPLLFLDMMRVHGEGDAAVGAFPRGGICGWVCRGLRPAEVARVGAATRDVVDEVAGDGHTDVGDVAQALRLVPPSHAAWTEIAAPLEQALERVALGTHQPGHVFAGVSVPTSRPSVYAMPRDDVIRLASHAYFVRADGPSGMSQPHCPALAPPPPAATNAHGRQYEPHACGTGLAIDLGLSADAELADRGDGWRRDADIEAPPQDDRTAKGPAEALLPPPVRGLGFRGVGSRARDDQHRLQPQGAGGLSRARRALTVWLGTKAANDDELEVLAGATSTPNARLAYTLALRIALLQQTYRALALTPELLNRLLAVLDTRVSKDALAAALIDFGVSIGPRVSMLTCMLAGDVCWQSDQPGRDTVRRGLQVTFPASKNDQAGHGHKRTMFCIPGCPSEYTSADSPQYSPDMVHVTDPLLRCARCRVAHYASLVPAGPYFWHAVRHPPRPPWPAPPRRCLVAPLRSLAPHRARSGLGRSPSRSCAGDD